MQKKLIALAVAGLVSGAAFAQSNVTIYGVVDAGFVNSSGDRAGGNNGNANFSGINSGILSGSRIGFKGEEGLGNGLKTVFLLEYGLDIDTNGGIGNTTSGLNARQTYVGLNHNKLGQVALGRQYAPAFAAWGANDAFIASAPASPLAILNVAGGNSIHAGSNARVNNAVTYTSPNWSGFTAKGIYGYGENGTAAANGVSQGNDGFFGAGLNYANGPLNVDFLYQSRLGVANTALAASAGAPAAMPKTQDSVNEWGLGGSYDFKVVKLFATYQDQNDNNGTSRTEFSNKVWSLGATVPVFGNGKIHASYAHLSWDNSNDTTNGDSSAWALGYTHALSKRTTLYTTYTRTTNDSDARVAAGGVAQTRFIGENNNTFTAGINHTF